MKHYQTQASHKHKPLKQKASLKHKPLPLVHTWRYLSRKHHPFLVSHSSYWWIRSADPQQVSHWLVELWIVQERVEQKAGNEIERKNTKKYIRALVACNALSYFSSGVKVFRSESRTESMWCPSGLHLFYQKGYFLFPLISKCFLTFYFSSFHKPCTNKDKCKLYTHWNQKRMLILM